MRTGRAGKFRWLVRIAVVATVAWLVWALVGLHVTEPGGPVSPEEAAAFSGFAVPPEAKNVRIAGYNQWIQYEKYMRFEAPVAVCVRAAAAAVPGKPLQPADEYELSRTVGPIRKDVFRDLGWFDLSNAPNVVAAGDGGPEPRVWVDQDRGVFYYRMTD